MGEARLKEAQVAAQFIYAIVRCEVLGGDEKVSFGWKRGEFAVVQNGPFHEIVHLPSALSFRQAGVFRFNIDAFRAVIEIDRLRNDWSAVDMDDFLALNTPICAICAKNFGRPLVGGPKELAVLNSHNGYSGKLPE
jgi:hypothetical protein